MTIVGLAKKMVGRTCIVLNSLVAVGCYADVDPSATGDAGRTATGGRGAQGGSTGEPIGGDAGQRAMAGAGRGTVGPPEEEPPEEPPVEEPVILNPAEHCDPAVSSEPLPARSSTMTAEAVPGPQIVLTSNLYNTFRAQCGACHSETIRLGSFKDQKVNSFDKFVELIDQSVIDSMRRDDLTKVMPPPSVGGKAWKDRAPNDPIVTFANLLATWLGKGKPRVSFDLAPVGGAQTKPYLFAEELGTSLTNIGNCIPRTAIVGMDTDKMDALDEKFAAMHDISDLPLGLHETDLASFDSAKLATTGVIAFAPSYPLWSDDAGKIRHVRVPRGASIEYDPETREFKIPPNTRFYKTFLKEVLDSAGRLAHRKIETRLIVARPDDCSVQPCRSTAIMASYAWDRDDETLDPRLVTEPLRNGELFADQVFTYPTDEPGFAALLKEGTPTEASLRSVTRHYAIPGKDRCVQCHEGSSSDSGILGFTPMQIKRWPYVEEVDLHAPAHALKGHGILREYAPRADEFSQLERLVEYGIITGLKSEDEVVPLKESQDVSPRNGYELIAQGYMLGNCAHCHNPEGYPVRLNPDLIDLDMYPDRDGGIFEFPLEMYSPRMRRGELQDNLESRIPYITPSLFDHRYDVGATNAADYKKHYLMQPTGQYGYVPAPVEAPWRSFIYRNVDGAFTYADDFAIFPHMPLHTAGFDCRAPRIMGNWMVSIPARVKPPQKDPAQDDGVVGDQVFKAEQVLAQPYEEVAPATGAHASAVLAARRRVLAYQQGERYSHCPDTSDTQAPEVLNGTRLTPRDNGYTPSGGLPTFPFRAGPDRPHWVPTDPTEPPPPWQPRRADWVKFLGAGVEPATLAYPRLPLENDGAYEARVEFQRTVMKVLSTTSFSEDLRKFATAEVPFGFWQQRPECAEKLKQKPTLLSLIEAAGAERMPPPEWAVAPGIAAGAGENALMRSEMDRPLYRSSPGAAVFNMVCTNCHGPLGDGDSVLATTVLSLTGGTTRVANLADGILRREHRTHAFQLEATKLSTTVDALAGRYLAWMALGGTEAPIPTEVLSVISRVDALDVPRNWKPPAISANMLDTALLLCQVVLNDSLALTGTQNRGHVLHGPSQYQALAEHRGDKLLWQRLCAFGRPPPIFEVYPAGNDWAGAVAELFWVHREPGSWFGDTDPRTSEVHRPLVYDAAAYGDSLVITLGPPTYQAGMSRDSDRPTKHRTVLKPARSLDPTKEPVAWCLRRPLEGDTLQWAEARAFAEKHAVDGIPLPFCPPNPKLWALERPTSQAPQSTTEQYVSEWPIRGAVNAGLAVFAYLEAVAKGEIQRTLQWNECTKLPEPTN